jgi:hypothetical protein
MNKERSNAIKLAGYMFFYLHIERHEYGRRNHESDRYYFNDGYVCVICGDVIDTWGRKGGVKSHLMERHPEWIGAYIILGGFNDKLENKVKELALDLLTNDMALIGERCKVAEEYDWYLCLLCGTSQYKDDCLSHIESNHPNWINAVWIIEKREKYVRKRRTYPLKPWKDPQSLFCSPNLKNIINKEPLHGDECRG